MKIIHTADWHLGNNFHGHDRIEEHQHFLDWLLQLLRTQMPDALIIAGDVFDSSNPPAAAEELFYNFLVTATEAVKGLQVVVTAGNHDSAGRLEAPARLLKRHNVYVRGTVRSSDEDNFDHLILPLGNRLTNDAEVVCVALPFLRPSDYPSGMSASQGLNHYLENIMRRIKKSDFNRLPVIVAAHFYAAGSEVCESEHSERLVIGGQDCVDAGIVGKGICYTALGHIHKAQQVKHASPIYYSGSALPMSFSERNYRHGVNIVEIKGKGETSVERAVYTPLRCLKSIPEHGTASASEILREIERLPFRMKNDNGRQWPYLEIRVEERQPEPTLMHDVASVLEQRAVRFCRMVRVLPQAKDNHSAQTSFERIQSLSPLDMAQRVFESKYKEKFPDELLVRFRKAEELAKDEE